MVPSEPPNYQFRKPHKWIIHTLMGGIVANTGLPGNSIKLVSMAGRSIQVFLNFYIFFQALGFVPLPFLH